jgi:hypothetical protein
METLKTYNGNGNPVVKNMPRIVIVCDSINDTALEHIAKNTDLHLSKIAFGYECQPESSNQIVRLLATYNFKTRYFDNWDAKNTIYLKFWSRWGVDHVCLDCLKANHEYIHDGSDPEARYSI